MSNSSNNEVTGSRSGSVEDQTTLIAQFVGTNAKYYENQFVLIGSRTKFTWTFNLIAAILGPIWFGLRGLWKWALPFTIVEAFALAQVGRGFWGDLASEVTGRIKMMELQLGIRNGQLEAAIKNNADNVDAFRRNIEGLEAIVEQSLIELQQIEASRIWIVAFGFAILVTAKIVAGILANPSLERRYSEWLSNRSLKSGMHVSRAVLSAVFVLLVYIVSAVHFSSSEVIEILAEFPTNPEFRLTAISGIEAVFYYIDQAGDQFFDGISAGIRAVLDFLEAVFVQTPWIVIGSFIITITAFSAGGRAAIYTGAFLAFMGIVGLWTLSMQTFALLGTAAFISIGFGIPLGIFCARRPRAYSFIRPIMDFQQTMPAFVYMVPIIVLFGAGKPAAVVTCLIFGTPPVVRLTVLGFRGVPEATREAAIAYGASSWYLMTKIDLPLAAPSIRAGMNQTILLSLLTVVIASLIGAKGLGEMVLEALQYADVGQGLLAGFSILFIAMILDRIVQGRRKGV